MELGVGTVKAVILFDCSVPGLCLTGVWGEGFVFAGTFPWPGYVFHQFPMLFLVYFHLVGMLTWHFAPFKEGFKNAFVLCYDFSNKRVLDM